jgi:hypothetical protein
MIRSTSSDAYSSSKAYSVGDHVIYNNKVYKCITACSAGSWSTNRSCFEQTTLTGAVSELNSAINWKKSSNGANISSLSFNELCILVKINNGANIVAFHLPSAIIDSTTKYIRQGSYETNSNNSGVTISINSSTVAIVSVHMNGTDYKSSSVIEVYYR